MRDLVRSGAVVKIGWVTGVGQAAIATPRFNYTRGPYCTDGMRVVLMMAEQHVPVETSRSFRGEIRGTWCRRRHAMPPDAWPGLVS